MEASRGEETNENRRTPGKFEDIRGLWYYASTVRKPKIVVLMNAILIVVGTDDYGTVQAGTSSQRKQTETIGDQIWAMPRYTRRGVALGPKAYST